MQKSLALNYTVDIICPECHAEYHIFTENCYDKKLKKYIFTCDTCSNKFYITADVKLEPLRYCNFCDNAVTNYVKKTHKKRLGKDRTEITITEYYICSTCKT